MRPSTRRGRDPVLPLLFRHSRWRGCKGYLRRGLCRHHRDRHQHHCRCCRHTRDRPEGRRPWKGRTRCHHPALHAAYHGALQGGPPILPHGRWGDAQPCQPLVAVKKYRSVVLQKTQQRDQKETKKAYRAGSGKALKPQLVNNGPTGRGPLPSRDPRPLTSTGGESTQPAPA